MLLSTTDTITGKKIIKQLGLAKGNTIRARHIGRDIMAIIRHMIGYRQDDRRCSKSRRQCHRAHELFNTDGHGRSI